MDHLASGHAATPSRIWRTVVSLAAFVLVTAVAALLGGAEPAAATHYRATQITWQQVSGNTVEFHATASWRCSFFADFGSPCSATVGDQFNPGDDLGFGDASTSSGLWTVTSVDVVNDVINAELEEQHTYAGPGPYTASLSACCRLGSGNGHINNGDRDILVSTVVDLNLSSANPVSAMAPIVDCALDAVCAFSVPAFDPDGQGLRWRLSTSAEAGSPFVQPGPPYATNAASIDPDTGLYSWDTTGATLALSGFTFYSTQVTVENVVSGVVVTSTAVDFFIRLGSNTTNQAPVFEPPTPTDGTVLSATVGSPVTFDVAASDPDAADTVTLNVLGAPAGSTFTTVPANPASGTFTWTPPAAGTFILTLLAQDNQGLGATPRSVKIEVSEIQAGSLTISKEFDPLTSGVTRAFPIDWSCDDSSSGTVDLAGGESATIEDLPVGTVCTVSETHPRGAPRGWYYGTPTITGSPATIAAGATSTVTVTNTILRHTSSLKIIKKVTGAPRGYRQTFSVHVACTGDGGTYDRTINFPWTGSVTISGIPTNSRCTVSEPTLPPPPAGYRWATPYFWGSPATVTLGVTRWVTVTNRLIRC